MKITREIGKEAQRSGLGYLAMASVFTIPLGLVLTLLAGWPLLVVTIVSHIIPACFVWATADVFYTAIVRNPLWGMVFGVATLVIGGCGFWVGLLLLGPFSPFDPFNLLPGLKLSLVLTSVFVLPALFLGALVSLRFQDIHKRLPNNPAHTTAGNAPI